MTRFTSHSTMSLLTLSAALAGILPLAACEPTAATAPGDVVALEEAALSTNGGFIEIDARETICAFIPGEQRVVNGVLHFSGFRAETRIESDDPRYDGESSVEFRGHRSLATGDGPGFGRFTIRPASIDGTWEGKWSGAWTGGLFHGTSVAHGTGALAGQSLHAALDEIHVDPTTTPCVAVVGTQFVESVRIHAAGGAAE